MIPAEVAYMTSAVDVDDRNALVMQELSQVYYIAARIRERLPQHVELEDLVNAGVIGLLEASRSYDSRKNPSSAASQSSGFAARLWTACANRTGARARSARRGAR